MGFERELEKTKHIKQVCEKKLKGEKKKCDCEHGIL